MPMNNSCAISRPSWMFRSRSPLRRPLQATSNRRPGAPATLFSSSNWLTGLCDAVATGHNLDDQAETVLYRLMRGSGTAGLSGIRISTDAGLIRPLLEINRAGFASGLPSAGFPGGKTAQTSISILYATVCGPRSCPNSPK